MVEYNAPEPDNSILFSFEYSSTVFLGKIGSIDNIYSFKSSLKT